MNILEIYPIYFQTEILVAYIYVDFFVNFTLLDDSTLFFFARGLQHLIESVPGFE